MLQPRVSRVSNHNNSNSKKTMTMRCTTQKVPHYWIYHKIPNSSRILVSLLGFLLLVLPNTFSQHAGASYIVEPTPVLRLNNDEDLTTVLLVKNDNGFGDHVHGRFLHVRPEVGLLTSTARTFIQEGVTTEYATQVVGTTLENGRLYAQLLKKSSRVLYEPSVVTSWVGENLQTKAILQSHNDLSNADQPDWQDIDDRLLLEKNSFVGNTDYVVGINFESKLSKQHEQNGANNTKTTTVTTSSSSTSSFSSNSQQQQEPVAASISEKARRIAANKVLPIGDLPTYTVKNFFAPSGYSSGASRTVAKISADIEDIENEDDIQRSPKLYYNQIMGSQGRITQGAPNALRARPAAAANAYQAPASRVLSTTTYYGFADFTTKVGDSVIVFSPSTAAANANFGHVTSIQGEATLSGGGIDNVHVSNVAITITQDLIEPTYVNQLPTHRTPATNVVSQQPPSKQVQQATTENNNDGRNQKQTTQASGIERDDSTREEMTTEEITTVRPPLSVLPAQLETSEVPLVDTITTSTKEISSSSGASLENTETKLLTRPSNEDILRIYASLASVEAARSTSSSTTTIEGIEKVAKTTAATPTPTLTTTESNEKGSKNDDVASKAVIPKEVIEATTSDIKILGGATTIFYEDDPFANFIEPTVKSQNLGATTAIEVITLSTVVPATTESTADPTYQQTDEDTTAATEDASDVTTTMTTTTDDTMTTEAEISDVSSQTPETTTTYQQSKEESSSSTTTTSLPDISPTPKLAVIVKEIDERNLDKIDVANCIRTSQIFLTQLPKTVTMYTTYLLPDSVSPEKTSTSIETNVVPTYTIEPATKHYCLQTQSVTTEGKNAKINTVVQLEKPATTTTITKYDENTSSDATSENDDPVSSTTPMIIVRQHQEVTERTTANTELSTSDTQVEDEEDATTEVNEDEEETDNADNEAVSGNDDDDGEAEAEEDDAEEFDLIYKTLYTTYTYLTTFFHDDTTSISSHKEVVTNVITSTIGPENDSGNIDATKLSTLLKDNEITPTNTRFVVPTELESILRDEGDAEKSQSLVEATPQLDSNKLTKTYYTTYTYYTTIFADGETEVMSRTEVYTNIVKHSIAPTMTTSGQQDQSTISSSILPQQKLIADTSINEDGNRVLEPTKVRVDTDTTISFVKLNYSTMQRSLENLPDLKNFAAVTLVTDVRSSSSNGDQQIINNNNLLNNAADLLEDQISSESNTDEIIPSATLLLQTSFTTFTYYTTMYSGDKTNVVSRLETVTNVVTETLKPTKVLNLEEATLPITYFTTFTYWTKLSKDGEITTLSREETVSNVVTPTATVSGAINSATIVPTQLDASKATESVSIAAEKDDVFNAIVTPVANANPTSAAEPTTYYTTYTYYTTSYVNDQTITDSRFETITNVVQPSISAMDTVPIVSAESALVEPVTTATNVLLDSGTSSANVPIILSYDNKKIIDADGISTLFFTTQVIATTAEGGIPTEVTSSSSSLQIDEVKKALLPTSTSSVLVNAEGSTVRQHKIGLVRLIEGTKIANHTTTLYQSKVIGTIIDNRYAQIIESTSSFLFEKTKSFLENEFNIEPTAIPKLAAVAPTAFQATKASQDSISVSPDAVHGSINDNTEDHTDVSSSDHDEEDGESDDSKNGLPLQSKKRTFTPVIRPFASRNRPQFAPKKKNGSPSSATIITRSDFTPTITATPALKSSGRFSGIRRASTAPAQNAASSSSPSRRFSRPSKGPASSNQPVGVSTSSSSFGFGANRNRLSSSRISPSSSSKRLGSSIRPSSSGGFRTGFSSVYAGSSRLRLKPTPATNIGQQSAASDGAASENNSEEESSTQEPAANDAAEDEETATENTRRNQNPLLRFRRPPVNRPAGFTPAIGQRQNSSGNSPVSPRRNPLAARAKSTTIATTTTTTTLRPRPRSFQRPTVGSFQGRTRPQNSLFPPRGLLQSQQQVTQDLEENSETKKSKEDEDFNDGGDAEDEYDDDEEEDGEEEGEDGANRRRRSNNKSSKSAKSDKPTLKSISQDLQNKKLPVSTGQNKRTLRVKREADTSFQTRSNFRNRFRRPTPATATEEHNSDEEIVEPEALVTTPQSSRPRISSRFNSRYQNHNLHHSSTTTTASTTSNHRAIRPTRPISGRAQFTLREKDITTTSTQKGLTTRHGNFRRPQTAASSRRSSMPTSNSRRLKSYSNSNVASENNSRVSNSRGRNGNIGNTQRNRATPARGRSRNDYNSDAALFGTFDGTITVTYATPVEVTIPVINGKITEYKNVVTAKTSTEVLSPHQYSSFVGSNGQTSLALTRKDTTVNFAGATEITQYVLQGTSTTTVTFTPTTIRGRKTSFSHVIPSTVYSVENVVSTVQPQISANAPLANILLSQLLLGNIGLPNNPLLGALGGVTQPGQLGNAVQATQAPATPVTEFRTHTSTYVTTLVEGMSTVLPITFQGKKILTTIFDTTAQTITATEFITDTIVSTPTQQPAQAAQVNSLLLQQLLLQQQLQPQQQYDQQQQQQLLQGLQAEQPAPLLLSDNLQELDSNNIRISNDAVEPLVEEIQAHKSSTNGGRKKNRKSGKTHKRNKQQQVEPPAQELSSVITLYVSGRRPGEFSTILSTIAVGYDSTLQKRQAAVHQTASIDTLEDLYAPDGSELISEYVLPDMLDSSARIHYNNAVQLERNMLELGENSGEQLQTQSLESIVGDVSLWYAKSTAQYEQQIQLKTKLIDQKDHLATLATDVVASGAPKILPPSSSTILRKLSSHNTPRRYRSIGVIPSAGIETETQFESSILDSGGYLTTASATTTSLSSSSSIVTTHIIDYGLSNEANEYDDFEIDYLENGEYMDDKAKAAEVARYNLATRIMSNGVEVIIAGDKSKTVEQNNINTNPINPNTQKSNILRVLQSQSQKPMTLAPSTLQDQMILVEPTNNMQDNYNIPIDTNQFITKTCLTTYTYRTTYLQNGQTTVESREKVISNIATEERNYLKLSPTLSLGVTLSRTPEFAVGVFPTTYTYYNTMFDGELPIVMTSKHTLSNTITGPDDYISFIQPSEAATPIQETNTYYKKVTLTKTWRDTDSSEQIVSTSNILTQVIVTESLPSRSTSVMTSYFAYDAFDAAASQEPIAVKTAGITEALLSSAVKEQTPLAISKNTVTDPLMTINSNQQLLGSKPDYDLHIYATKTFLTTFTYFTTTLLKSANSANLVLISTPGILPSSSLTVVNYHTRVIENVITETIPSSLLGPNLLSRFYIELKKSKNQRKVIVTQAVLSGGQTLEITAMKIIKNESAAASAIAPISKQQSPIFVSETTTTQPLSVTISTESTNLKLNPPPMAAPPPVAATTNHSNKSNEIIAVDEEDSDSVVASSEQEATYVSSSFAEQPPLKPPKASARPSPASYVNDEHITKIVSPTTGKPQPPSSTNFNQIIGSFNLQRLTALRPVLNAMAGLLNDNFGIGGTTADNSKYPTAKHPPPPLKVESKHALKNITVSNNGYEIPSRPATAGYFSFAERPIYIPVQNLVAISDAQQQLSNFSNSTLAYHDNISLTPPQSLHIHPPAADVVLSNENWHQEAASKLLPTHAASGKNHKSSSSTFETPLLNGGIPISPGEVITANSDVIIGRPNGIQHPRVPPLNGKSETIQMSPPPAADNNVAATSQHVLSQPADMPYTTFYQHFIQHPQHQPYKKKSALSNVSPKIIPFKEQILQTSIPISAHFNESILIPPPPFLQHSNDHQSSPPLMYAKTYAALPPPSYIQLPPPPPQAQQLLQNQKINQHEQQHRLQQHLAYIPQGYSETKYFSRLPTELYKIYNFNKELQNNEILEIKRIPEVFSTDLPPETEFSATYLTTQRPVEGGDVVQLGHAASSPNLLINVQPTRITNIVVPPHDNAASALVVASTTSMLYNHHNDQYYDAAAAVNSEKLSTPMPTRNKPPFNPQPSKNHQKINFDTYVFSHNVDINVPPLTFKKDADAEFPPSSAPVLGQIPTNQMTGTALNLLKMPLVKIPFNEAQVQVELTPQRFIGSVIESNRQPSGGGIYKQKQKQHQLTTDNSAIGSFALEPHYRGASAATKSQQQQRQHQHANNNIPERHGINNNQLHSTYVTIPENPFSMEKQKTSSANNFGGLKIEPTTKESLYSSSTNFGLRNKPLTGGGSQSVAVEYTIGSQPYPPHNMEETQPVSTYQQTIKSKSPNKKQRRPSLGSLLPQHMNPTLDSYQPTTTTQKTTAVSKFITRNPPPQQNLVAGDYWNHNLVTNEDDATATSKLNDDAAASSLYIHSVGDQKVEASLNSLSLPQQPQQQHKEHIKSHKNKWPVLSDMSIRDVNNMPNLLTTPSSHFTAAPTPTTRNPEVNKILSKGKPFEATSQTKTTSFSQNDHSLPQKIFVTLGERFKYKVAINETTSITTKYQEKMPTEPNNDGDDEIFDYYETSNPHNFESVNTTGNIITTSTSKATPPMTNTATHTKIPTKDNATSMTTKNNKNNGLYHMLTPQLNIRPPLLPSATLVQQQLQTNKAVVGLSPPPPPQPQTPATTFSLPTIPYKTINYTSSNSSSNNDIQRLSLQLPPPPPKLSPSDINSQTSRQPIKRPIILKPPKVLTSSLLPLMSTTLNPQLMYTPILSSTPFAISTSINFIPRLGQMESSSRIRFQKTETPYVERTWSKVTTAAVGSNSATKSFDTTAQTTNFSQQQHNIKPTVTKKTTRTTTISNSVIPSEPLFSSSVKQHNNVKNQHRANTQLLPRHQTKQRIILPTKFVTNTQVLTVTTTKTTVLTVAGRQSTKTLTYTKTQTATILDTVTETEIHTLLQPTRVTESHIILATTVPVPVHIPVAVTAAAAPKKIPTVSSQNSIDDRNQYDLSNHKPYENHTYQIAFDVDETKFSGTAHPSVEVVLPDAAIIQQQQQEITTPKSNHNDTTNNSIFIVMTDSNSKTGNKKGIININPSMLESAHEINGIGVISADTTSSGAGGTAGDTTGTYTAADSGGVALDYYDNVSFDFPTLDEESNAPDANKANHVLLGGVLIATPPKSSSSPRKPTDSNIKKQNAMEVAADEHNTSVGVVGYSLNAICRPSCKASRNELCMRIHQTSTRCVCRPGFARMFPDRPCKPTYTYAMQIRLHRLGKDLLNFEEHLLNNESEEFRQLAAITHDAVDRMVMQSDFRDVYHGVHLTSFEALKQLGQKDETIGNETVANFLLQLSDNSDEKRLANVFKKYLRQSNYSIGGTKLYTTKNAVESMAVVDFDECVHSKFHDCSNNARCFNLQGTYTCSCQEGYADLSENSIYPGRLCSAEMIGCEKCHYHGKCVASINNNNNNNKQSGASNSNTPICECFPWYTGATCQLNLKILLIALIAIGTLLFILLLFCILVTCTKRSRHNSARSVLASSMHKLATAKNTRLTPTAVSGMRGKNLKIDKRAMIKDSSSETSQNSLPYVLKEPTASIKKQHIVHHSPASIYYDGGHKHSGSLQMVHHHHQGNEQLGALSSTLITALEHSINELQHYPEQTDRSLTVMIPRAKYHPTVLPSTQLLHHQLTMERIPHSQNKAIANISIPGAGTEDMHGHADSDAEHMQLSNNALSVDKKKPSNVNKRTSVSSQRTGGGIHASNTSVGALVSAGFEVSATVSGKLLNNTSNAMNSSTITTTNDSVSAHNGVENVANKHRDDNGSTDSGGAAPAIGTDAYVYSTAAVVNELHHHHQMLPNCMTEMHMCADKTEASESHDSEYNNNNYKNGEDLIDSMDVWLDTMHQTELAAEARSFDETTVHAPTKSMRSCYGNQNSQPNDEANTMAERDIGSTFLLPHTHLYKPDRQESDMSGFDSV